MARPEPRRVRVDLVDRGYDVVVGQGTLDDPDIFDAAIRGRDVLVVTNETVGPLYLERLLASLGRAHAS